MTFACFARLAVSCAVLAVTSGCSNKAQQQTEQPLPVDSATPIRSAEQVPASADTPIPFTDPIRPPSEPRENLLGPAVVVADTATSALYLLDLGRGRLLGPAPRYVDVSQKIRTLPGYPLTLPGPIQDATAVPGGLAVADGDAGSVAFVRWQGHELQPPVYVHLPSVNVRVRARDGGGYARTGRPFVIGIASVGSNRVVAVARDDNHAASVAYLVDLRKARVLRHVQLPFGAITVASDGSSLVAISTSDSAVTLLNQQLDVLRRVPLPGEGFYASFGSAGELFVSTEDPYVVVRVARTGSVHQVWSAPGSERQPMPIAAAEAGVWVGLEDSGRVLQLSPQGRVTRSIPLCVGITNLLVQPGFVVGGCRRDGAVSWRFSRSGRGGTAVAGDFISALVHLPA